MAERNNKNAEDEVPDSLSFSGKVVKLSGNPYGLDGKRTKCCRPSKKDRVRMYTVPIHLMCFDP